MYTLDCFHTPVLNDMTLAQSLSALCTPPDKAGPNDIVAVLLDCTFELGSMITRSTSRLLLGSGYRISWATLHLESPLSESQINLLAVITNHLVGLRCPSIQSQMSDMNEQDMEDFILFLSPQAGVLTRTNAELDTSDEDELQFFLHRYIALALPEQKSAHTTLARPAYIEQALRLVDLATPVDLPFGSTLEVS